MTVDEAVADLIDRYPTLAQQRWQALRRLFCVKGNEFVWHDGERVDEAILYGGSVQRDNSPMSERKARLIAKTAAEPIGFQPQDHLCEVPVDVKPDWAAAWREIADLMAVHRYAPMTVIFRVAQAADHVNWESVRVLSSGNAAVYSYRAYRFFTRDGEEIRLDRVSRKDICEAVALFENKERD